MHRPELLLLDEPTSGLDPLVQHELRLMADARAGGATVFSSHALSEVQETAARVAKTAVRCVFFRRFSWSLARP